MESRQLVVLAVDSWQIRRPLSCGMMVAHRAGEAPGEGRSGLQFTSFNPSMATQTPTRKRMVWVIFVAGAVLSWGAYGALLHQGQTQLGNPLKALLCVGIAYFLIGVLVPVATLSSQGALSGFNTERDDPRHRRRRARRGRRGVHHLCVQDRRSSGLRDAARVRRRPDRQCSRHDVSSSAEGIDQSDAVRGISARLDRRGDGPVLPAAGVTRYWAHAYAGAPYSRRTTHGATTITGKLSGHHVLVTSDGPRTLKALPCP